MSDLKQESFIAYGERWASSFFQTRTGMCPEAGYTPHTIQEIGGDGHGVGLVAADRKTPLLERLISIAQQVARH